MTTSQVKNFIKNINTGREKDIVIRINPEKLSKGIKRSRNLLERIEREMRIQRLELAVKKLKINRSWI